MPNIEISHHDISNRRTSIKVASTCRLHLMAKDGFYAVAVGRSTGVFTTWTECETQVKGFTGCKYKKFKTKAEAQAFVRDHIGPRDVVGFDADRKRKRLGDETFEDERSWTAKRKRDTNGASYTVDRDRETSIVTHKEEIDTMHLDSVDARLDLKLTSSNFLVNLDNDQKSTSLMTMLEENEKSRRQKSAVNVDVILNDAAPEVVAAPEAVAESQASASSTKLSSKEQVVMQHAAASKRQEDDNDPNDPTTLVAFCDGSALNNGRQNCRAGYACIFPHCEEWNVAKQLVEERVSNNRAEYMGALEAMKRANVEDPDGSRLLYIFSDSMLLIRSMTEWVGAWQQNNWRKSDGKPVQNHDLLELLVAEKGDRCIRWHHVKAHTGKNDWKSKWNDVADHAARNAASRGGKV